MTTNELMNLLVGVISSIIAATIVLVFTYRSNKRKLKLKYCAPVGEYSGYNFSDTDPMKIELENPISFATIKYLSANKLQLTLKELNYQNQWSGIVAMETENYGTVTWQYDILYGKIVDITTHRFGFKRLIYLNRDGRKLVYLIGEEGFAKEILIQMPI